MGDAKRRKGKPAAIELPIAEQDGITATDIFPTLAAIWDDIANTKHPGDDAPFLQKHSRETRQMTQWAAYRAVSEVLRTVCFRVNADQADTVFGELDAEIRAFDRQLAAEQVSH
jgi:hypothetical protein